MISFKEYISISEKTIKDTIKDTTEFRFSPDNYPQAKFLEIKKMFPQIGVKTLQFLAEVPSFTRREASYNVNIVFKDVEFSEEDRGKGWRKLPDKDIWYKLPTLSNNHILMRCNCKDFRFRSAWAYFKKKSLFGRPIMYVKKTDRPPLNPGDKMLFCKHIDNVIEALIAKDYISGD